MLQATVELLLIAGVNGRNIFLSRVFYERCEHFWPPLKMSSENSFLITSSSYQNQHAEKAQ